MPNRSLQETLFQEKSDNLTWNQRFRIVQDVARALTYMHLECDPPIIHGDIKPSNVLLDMDFRARVSDFGLSRVKEDEEAQEEFETPFSQELSGNLIAASAAEIVEAGSSRHYGYNEVDFARALQASTSPKSECMFRDHLVLVEDNVIDDNDEVGKTRDQGIYCEDGMVSGAPRHCLEDDLEDGRTHWGKDWWWRQDGNRELRSKDYVTEWIGSQICPNSDDNIHHWDDSHRSPVCNDSQLQLQMGELVLTKKIESNRIGERDKKMHRKLHEWWGEEHPVVISKTRSKLRKLEKKWSKSFKKPILTISRSVKIKRKRKFRDHDNAMHCSDSHWDSNFTKTLKKKKEAHPEVNELWSGDLFSRELSSTTSMRGTLCYIAPECGGGGGGCGYLMEKTDIYSFGVLILVIVSGRRPLHVLSSPMKLEKANLVSWCRQLAQSGNLLELIDKRLKTQGYDEVQATLCINLALSCLQKMPELRPDICDVVKVLDGEMDMPDLPFELSPSPPPKLSRSRSRHKAKGG